MNSSNTTPGMLSGYRVLDLSDHRGFACAKFLASMGAEVLKIDSPKIKDAPDETKTEKTKNQLWRLRNLGKKSITLDLDSDTGIEIFKDLVAKSDFIIETFQPGTLADKNIGYEQLKAINEKIILVSITPFGQTGPYKDYKGGELISSAMGGTLDTCGYPDDTPVLEALDACSFHAAAAAGFGAMLAHRERGISGLGQHVDCSIQEVAASRNTNNLIAYQFDKRKLDRSGNKVRFGLANVRVVWELADGYCFHSIMTGKFGAPANSALSKWMSDEGFDNPMANVDWEKYDRSALDADTRLSWEAAIHTFFISKTKQDIANEGKERGIRATIANAPNDVINDQHLVSRGFFQDLDVTENKTLQYPDYFLRFSEGQYRIPKLLPLPGKDNQNVFEDILKLDEKHINTHAKKGVF